jgi:Tol biopolymer transport system component
MLKVNMFLQYWHGFFGGLKKNKMKRMVRIKEIQRQRMVNGKVYGLGVTSLFTFLILHLFLIISMASAQQASDVIGTNNFSNTLNSRIENVQRITPFGNYRNPIWSPMEPSSVAFVGGDGTFIFSPTDKKIFKLTNEIAGFNFFWTKDGKSIVYRTQIDERLMVIKQIGVETGRVSILVQSGDLSLPQEVQPGTIQYRDKHLSKALRLSKTTSESKVPFVYQQNDHIYVVINQITKQITKGNGKYFSPKLSPDGSKILYQEIARGLYVTDLQNDTTIYLGKGDDATWSPDGKYVIYEITVDDGHSIISSELYIVDLYGQKMQLTNTPQLLEMRPSWSPDGKRIAFDGNGAIFMAEIVPQR